MGENTLGRFMISAALASGLKEKKLTNHSVRKTMIQRLVDAKFSPNEVAQLSGHKNLKSLDSYMKASAQTQKDMSFSLSCKAADCSAQSQVATVWHPPSSPHDTDFQQLTTKDPISNLFTSNSFTGCTIQISINHQSTCTDGSIEPQRK